MEEEKKQVPKPKWAPEFQAILDEIPILNEAARLKALRNFVEQWGTREPLPQIDPLPPTPPKKLPCMSVKKKKKNDH